MRRGGNIGLAARDGEPGNPAVPTEIQEIKNPHVAAGCINDADIGSGTQQPDGIAGIEREGKPFQPVGIPPGANMDPSPVDHLRKTFADGPDSGCQIGAGPGIVAGGRNKHVGILQVGAGKLVIAHVNHTTIRRSNSTGSIPVQPDGVGVGAATVDAGTARREKESVFELRVGIGAPVDAVAVTIFNTGIG